MKKIIYVVVLCFLISSCDSLLSIFAISTAKPEKVAISLDRETNIVSVSWQEMAGVESYTLQSYNEKLGWITENSDIQTNSTVLYLKEQSYNMYLDTTLLYVKVRVKALNRFGQSSEWSDEAILELNLSFVYADDDPFTSIDENIDIVEITPLNYKLVVHARYTGSFRLDSFLLRAWVGKSISETAYTGYKVVSAIYGDYIFPGDDITFESGIFTTPGIVDYVEKEDITAYWSSN